MAVTGLTKIIGGLSVLNAGNAAIHFNDGDTQKGVGSSLIAAGLATNVIDDVKFGGRSAALAGVGALAIVAGLGAYFSAD